MKKFASILILLLVFSLSVAAEVKFKDLPADHWAAKSVYNLVKMGITTGYPDGTFRGKKNITRYETAIFLSKLADKLGGEDLKNVKTELEAIKTEISALKKTGGGTGISGSFEMNNMLANIIASGGVVGKGPIVNYRLKTTLNRELGENAGLKVNLDTMDAGYYGGTRDLVKEMLDVEGRLRVNPVDLGVLGDLLTLPLDITVTAGPSIIQHVDATGIASSENDICYIRPDTGMVVSTKIWNLEFSGSYLVGAYALDNSGKVDTNYLAASVGYEFQKFPILNNLKLVGEGSAYLKNPNSNGPRDLRGKIAATSQVNPKVTTGLQVALGKSDTKGWMVGAELKVSDFIISGGSFLLRGAKVGSEFIPPDLAYEEFGETGYDIFMRPLLQSTVNIDAEFDHPLAERLKLKGKGAARLSGDYGYGQDKPLSRLTGQIGVTYNIANDTSLDAFYRAEQDPTISETTDLTAVGIMYKF
jgi:hypothetical protein